MFAIDAPDARPTSAVALSTLVMFVAAAVGGCASDDNTRPGEGEVALETPQLTITKKDDGTVVKRYDTDDDGKANVVEHVEHYEDPNDPEVVRKRLVKKLVDVNGDGQFDIVKRYDKQGKLQKEIVDDDLDGTKDRISYFSDKTGKLTRKEIFASNGETVVAKRFYTGGTLDRAEEDTDGDGSFDMFEYYSGGDIQRIGRDKDGDGEIDSWTHGTPERTAERSSAGGDAPTVPAPAEGGEGGGESGESGESGGGESSEGSESGESGGGESSEGSEGGE